jgi:bifunctional enzyme CysN/CysC
MSHKSELIATDIEAYLAEHEQKDLLRFLTCGSVDDGKSTLIGRLLHDSHLLYEDQLAAVEAESTTIGSAGGELDLALLMDGLKAEREQGITIDVAYRYFSTSRRKFIIADTPGHEQYTRNMVTGASTCDLAIILVDARHGVQVQTKRHSYLTSLLGIENTVVAVNKMDLVDHSKERFDEIREEYLAFAEGLDLKKPPVFIPMSALKGDWVVEPGDNMTWFEGPTLMEHLETVRVEPTDVGDLRFPVQLVNRPDLTFRGFQGTVAAGVIQPGDEVMVLPSGTVTNVDRIVTFDGDIDLAGPGSSVTVTLTDEVDVSRGDVLVHPDARPQRSHEIQAMVVWMSEAPMALRREYLVQQANRVVPGRVTEVAHRVDVNTLATDAEVDGLALNEIGRCTITCDQQLLFDAYDRNRTTGAFILVDRLTNATMAAGMILPQDSAWDVEPDQHLQRHLSQITTTERVERYGQQPATILLTGLTGAGKSTMAVALERRLFDAGRTTLRIDGEDLRLGMSRDLGFSAQERSENLRRMAEVARLANEAGIIVIAAFSSPKADVRERAKELVGTDRFLVVHLDVPVEVARQRDPEGLYDAAERGDIPQFPGVSATYDVPENPDLTLDTADDELEDNVEKIIDLLVERGFLGA